MGALNVLLENVLDVYKYTLKKTQQEECEELMENPLQPNYGCRHKEVWGSGC